MSGGEITREFAWWERLASPYQEVADEMSWAERPGWWTPLADAECEVVVGDGSLPPAAPGKEQGGILAWRIFRTGWGDGLRSLNASEYWKVDGLWKQAVCRNSSRRSYRQRDSAPHSGHVHGCGFYAYRTFSRAKAEAGGGTYHIGAVLLSGRVLAHEDGWRASQARLLADYGAGTATELDIEYAAVKEYGALVWEPTLDRLMAPDGTHYRIGKSGTLVRAAKPKATRTRKPEVAAANQHRPTCPCTDCMNTRLAAVPTSACSMITATWNSNRMVACSKCGSTDTYANGQCKGCARIRAAAYHARQRALGRR